MIKATLTKSNILLGPVYSFRSKVRYLQSRKLGSMEAETVLAKGLRLLHLDSKVTRRDW